MPDTTPLPVAPARGAIPPVGHRRAAWSVHELTSLNLALHGQADGLRFQQYEAGAISWAVVEGPWAWPEAAMATAGLNALIVRYRCPDRYFDTGCEEFDRTFALRGEPREWVLRLLDADTRRHLLELAALAGPFQRRRRVRFEIGRGRVALLCYRRLGEDAALLDRFLDRAVTVLRRLLEMPDRRLEIVRAGEAVEEAHCLVCGEDLAGALLRCDRCGALHHEECFLWTGRCARYACGGRFTTPARLAHPE